MVPFMYNDDNTKENDSVCKGQGLKVIYETFGDPVLENYWEQQGISFLGIDFKVVNGKLVESDAFEQF
jgi:hypothetical protein